MDDPADGCVLLLALITATWLLVLAVGGALVLALI